MQDDIYSVPEHWKQNAHINAARYEEMYSASINDPDTFWGTIADEFLTWDKRWDKVQEADLTKGEVSWFIGGELNASVNCIDRHLENRADQVAIIWEGDDPGDDKKINYQELHEEVSRLGNLLR